MCPTGSIDEWRVVNTPYTLEQQFDWMELPEQQDLTVSGSESADAGATQAAHPEATGPEVIEALDDNIIALLNEAHSGAGGKARAPATAGKPGINLYNKGRPADAVVQGNFRLTSQTSDSDVRHIILDLGALPFPVLEGQSVGITPPGVDDNGKPHLPRLYSISSPRDGERPNYNNISLTIKREEKGLCSNYVCDLKQGDTVQLTGPFGATFLMPNDNDAKLLMVCTGTGSAPFRAFTMRRQRSAPAGSGNMMLIFGARTPESLPYFGPLKKVPDSLLAKHLVFSREEGKPRRYVQDEILHQQEKVLEFINDGNCHIYICGLRAMEEGVNKAFAEIATASGLNWEDLKRQMRDSGRYHVETY